MKIGVELEYWTINKNGELVSCREVAQEFEFTEQEFVEPLLEVKTRPNSDIRELEDEITSKLYKIQEELDKKDLMIVPLGTPLNSGEINSVNSRRAEIQEIVIGNRLEAAKRVAGTHIHFELGDNPLEKVNRLISLDPALALVNSSAYYQGEDLASSSRNEVYRYHCYEEFPKHGQLWSFIDSMEEWYERMEERFNEFIEAADNNDIRESEVREYFSKEDALWTPVRVRPEFGTVEWRSPDSCSLEETLKLIKEMKRLMEEERKDKTDFEKVKTLSKEAIRKGTNSGEVESYLKHLDFNTENFSNISSKIKKSENMSTDEAKEKRIEAAENFRKEIYSS